jgi:hypothetical protein
MRQTRETLTMIDENQNIMQGDRTEQARLALTLIDSLGLDGAIFACRANGWDGVLDLLVGGGREGRGPTTPVPVFHC